MTVPFAEPGLKKRGDGGGERDCSLLASLALAADVRAGPEGDVAAVESGELGDPQAGLDGQQHQDSISSSFPTGLVRGCDEGVDFGCGQERHDPFVEPLRWDGQDTLDEESVFGVAQRGVGEQ
jgi:hypothetical protein